MTFLTIVLISKNQAWNIERLIRSVLDQAKVLSTKEVMLVDSASTDDTVQRATHYPITILRLCPNQHLSPAAGRYVGYTQTTGDLVLFLDGDMELYPGWLESALQVLRTSPDIAAVTGQIVDLSSDLDKQPLQFIEGKIDNLLSEVQHVGGAALYRRSVLKKVGSFNPYLFSDEEPELCVRIRHAGWRVIGLRFPIAYHYAPPREALSTLVSRWRRGLYLGAGQSIRYHVGHKTFFVYLWERGYGILPGLILLAGLLSTGWSYFYRDGFWFACWISILCVALAIDALRRGSVYFTLSSVLKRLFILDGTIRGFFLHPRLPESYTAELEVIQSQATVSQLPPNSRTGS
jgi:glycosyltransferase involved in cell wall biosynthesis